MKIKAFSWLTFSGNGFQTVVCKMSAIVLRSQNVVSNDPIKITFSVFQFLCVEKSLISLVWSGLCPIDDIRTNRTRINLTEKCLRNYLPKTINSIPNHILTRIDTHSIEGFASAVKHYLISKYSIECQDENCYVCQRQPRSWFVNCSPLTTMCILHLYRYFVLIAHLVC